MKPFNINSSMLEKVSNLVPIILAFLVPIFFLPISTEFYSFNKLALITAAVILLIILWGIKTIAGLRLEITKSILDIPILVLLGVTILSTIFSVNKTNSIWGSQGRWLGLFAFLMIIAYFYLSTPTFKNPKLIKRALIALVASATVSSVVSILSYYKIYLGSYSFLSIQNFTLAGSVTDVIIVSSIATVVAFSLALQEREVRFKVFYFPVIAINFYYVSITGTLTGWVLVGLGLLLVLLFTGRERLLREKIALLVVAALILPILTITHIPQIAKVFVDKSYPLELKLTSNSSWFISTSTVQDYPMLGTGPSTFDLNFTRYKPLSMNSTNLWGIKFDKPNNEVYNTLATIGLLGIVAALFLVSRTIKFVYVTKDVKDEGGLSIVTSAFLAMILVSFLFTYASILTTFLFFFALSLLIGVHSINGNMSKYTKPLVVEMTSLDSISSDNNIVISSQYMKYILSIPTFLIAGYLGYLAFKDYAAEYYMKKGLVAVTRGDSANAYIFQNLAIKYNPSRDTYYDSLARLDLAIAGALAAKTNITDVDKATIQTLVSEAIRNARIATEVASPLNTDNWETRAIIYKNIGGMAANATDWAIGSYNTAITLDPTNPRLRVDLGGVYFAKGDYLSAANLFRQAASLKSDYANAHFNFALALANLKQYDQAKSELDMTKMLVVKGSADEKLVDEVIAQLPIAQAVTEGNKPTVEQLSGVQTPTTQEPLTNTGTAPATQLTPKVLPNANAGTAPAKQITPTATPTLIPTPTKK